MSHLTVEEKHDAAYGFRDDRHCAECLRDVEALSHERVALRRVFAVEPAAVPCRRAVRPRRPWWLLVPAAALVAAMVRLVGMSAPPPEARPEVVPAQDADEFLARCARLLASPSEAKRAAAKAALTAHGSASLPALDAAGTPASRALADEIRCPDPRVREMRDALQEKRVTVKVEATLEDVCAALRDKTGLNILIEASLRETHDLGKKASVEVREGTIEAALGPFGVVVVPAEGAIVVTNTAGRDPALPARRPLRVAARAPAGLEGWIAALGSASAEERASAAASLLEHALAAEQKLWDALDGPHAKAVADLLGDLYGPEPPAPRLAALERRLSLDRQNTPARDVLEEVAQRTNTPMVVSKDVGDAEIFSIKVTGIVAAGALKLMLLPRELDYTVVDDVVWVGRRDRMRRTRAAGSRLVWFDDRERERAGLVVRAAKGDARAADALRSLEDGALPPLRYAARVLPAAESERCARLAEEIADSLRQRGVWLPDEPAALDRAGGLPDAVARALGQNVSLDVKDGRLGEALATLAAQSGIAISADDPTPKVMMKVTDVPLRTALKLLAGSCARDVQLNGATLVVR